MAGPAARAARRGFHVDARSFVPVTPLLRVHDLSWRAGETAIVSGVAFEALGGDFVAVMGRNGAGKSTVLDLIAGLRTPVSGGIDLEGRPLAGYAARDRARVVAHLPQAVRPDLPFVAA